MAAVVHSVMPVFDNGWTSAWKNAFNEKRVLPGALPPVADLETFLGGELPVKIGVPESFYKWGLQFWHPAKKIFKPTDSEPCVEFLNQVGYRAIRPAKCGDTKATYISHWDDSIRHVLEFVLDGQSTRYSIEAPLDGGPATPDFVFMLDSVCVVRGEEQGPKPLVADAPRFRKFDEVRWSHVNVPYLFGYTTDASAVTLYALTQAAPDSNQTRARRLDSYNISSTASRLQLLLAVLNMSRLLSSIASLCPRAGRDEYRVLRRSNGVEIFLEPTRVTKTFLPHIYPEASCRGEEVYRVLDAKGVPSSDRLLSANDDARRMVFTPRGRKMKPKTLDELFGALVDVLRALDRLHAFSWMHRDIRWPNVMRRYDGSNSWFLIDFMDAASSPADASSGNHLCRDSHAPEIFDTSCEHTTAVDIWSLGYLIETCSVRWDDFEKRTAFKNELMHGDHSKRPTARAALQRLMELKKEYLDTTEQKGLQGGDTTPTKRSNKMQRIE